MPSTIMFLCMFLGFLLWPLRRKRRIARNFFFTALFLYLTFGTAPGSNFLLWWLERPFHAVKITEVQKLPVNTLVVLMGGVRPVDSPFPDERLKVASRLRLLTAWQYARKDTKINRLVVVGAGNGYPSLYGETSLADDWLNQLGLPKRVKLVIVSNTYDTKQNIVAIHNLLKTERFGLVTSASHMRRALYFAREFGLNPYPLPCDFIHRSCNWSVKHLWPDPSCLINSDLAVHEYLGLTWAWICHFFVK